VNGRWRAAWPIAAAVLACAWVLWPLLRNRGAWNHDELDILYLLRQGQALWSWTGPWDASALFFRPVGFAALTTQLEAGGTAPCFHWISIAHHLLNAWLAALLFSRLGCARVAVVLFVLLPSSIGAVAWVAALYDRLAVTFVLLGCLALLSRRPLGWLVLPASALALLSKETAVAFGLAAWLPVFRWTPSAHRWALGAAAVAAGFAVWRFCAVRQELGGYEPDLGLGAGLRVLRYVCFPFALGAAEPSHVVGSAWVPGLLGSATVVVLSGCRDLRATLGACIAIAASLLPIAGMQQAQPHYTYASSLCWAFLIAQALGRRPGDGAWRTAALWLLVPLLAWSARRSAECFELAGRTMANLEAAYVELPAGEVAVAAETPIGHSAALRFSVHVRQCHRSPPLRVIDAPPPAGALLVAADGSVRRQ
jgi:hypothetical protein